MISIQHAQRLVENVLQELEKKSLCHLKIMEGEIIEFKYGWIFFYQSEEFVVTGNEDAMVGGNAPIIVDKFNATTHITGTRYGENFYLDKYCKFRDNIKKFYEEIG
ncbi:YrhB domain-containing protein [Runella sp.]|uniref:YrhB domain-containing protein n=1 Tax=Runella sp. TaxID=1960881 RepID=UPI003D0A71FE